MPRRAFITDKITEAGVVGVLFPPVVVTEVLAGVIGGIGQDQVDLVAVAVKRRHRLEVVTFNYKIACSFGSVTGAILGDRARHARSDATGETPGIRLTGEGNANSAFELCIRH